MRRVIIDNVRDAQHELRAASRHLRQAAQHFTGPHIIKALAKTIEAFEETSSFFQMLEEEGEDEED